MKICACCRERFADKKNTHYLTDGIIRSCLNEDGSNTREKAMMFDISSGKTSIEARFQRSTSQKAILRTFGREASEEEIVEAKTIPFSVDNVFCSVCEDLFTGIENRFIDEILPQLRGHDFTGHSEIIFKDIDILRQFFLLQVYRTAVCDPEYGLASILVEKLREFILNEHNDVVEIMAVPLSVTYLNTVGTDYEYTKNTVGIALIENQKMILFNDFAIQVAATPEDMKFVDFWGINERETFKQFVNYSEDTFVIKVVDNKKRLAIWDRYHQELAKKQVTFYRRDFTGDYLRKYHRPPSIRLVRAFVSAIIEGDEVNDDPRYSMERFERLKDIFLKKR